MSPACNERADGEGVRQLSVGDAVEVLVQLEHFLRPLASHLLVPSYAHDGQWSRDAPRSLGQMEIGDTVFDDRARRVPSERYLSYLPGTLSQAARTMVLRFFKLLVETAYENADIVAPVCRYNRLWEMANGTSPEKIRPVHNGIYLNSFPAAVTDPAVPTLVFVGRIEPVEGH